MNKMHRNRLAAAIALSWLGAAGSAAQAQVIDLDNLGSAGFRIVGASASDLSGFAVCGAGDVNGDGLADLIVGAYRADPGGRSRAGESYVVFGKANNTPVDLGALGSDGFRIDGIDADDDSGRSVSGAGDVNGDGLADLIVGARGANSGAGESYVVFGKATSTLVDLAALGSAGFRIDGIVADDDSGFSVSGAGDVNGDGLADLIVGARLADPGGEPTAGQSFVVFGKTSASPVALASLGSGGFRIDGIDVGDSSGYSVSGAGDFNGDGLADLIVGAHGGGAGGTGESYLVFGKTSSAPVNLATPGSAGFRINGVDSGDFSGRSVSGAGDVNGDGLADLIIGAILADPGGDNAAGESYVVFGKTGTTPIDLAALGSGGFRIDGIDPGDYAGIGVSGAGDVDGDGLADLIVGALGAAPGGDADAGQSYVVFGKTSATPVNLAALGSGGIRLDGIDPDDRSGRGVSGAGDVNGDGLADVIVGASQADPGGAGNAGESYVVFSTSVPPLSASYGTRSANGNPPRTAIGIVGDGSNDSHPAARAWIDFANGADPALAASAEIVTLTRSSGAFSLAAANVHWQIQSTRASWTSAEVRFRYLDSELSIGNENTLELVYSADGAAPFTPLISVVNPQDNTISANITQSGFLYLGERELPPLIFADGFE